MSDTFCAWPMYRLGDIVDTSSGGTPSRKNKNFFGGSIPWVKSGELNDGLVRSTEETLTEQGLATSNARLLPRGTLLMAMYGATVGKLGILDLEAATNQAICTLLPHGLLNRDYLFWYLYFIRKSLVHKSFGAAQPNISQTFIRQIEIPVPPLEEQRRIVARIEALTRRVEEVRKELAQADAELTTFTPALLAKAFRGEL